MIITSHNSWSNLLNSLNGASKDFQMITQFTVCNGSDSCSLGMTSKTSPVPQGIIQSNCPFRGMPLQSEHTHSAVPSIGLPLLFKSRWETTC